MMVFFRKRLFKLAVLLGISVSSLVLFGLQLKKINNEADKNVRLQFHNIALPSFLQGGDIIIGNDDQYNIKETSPELTPDVSNTTDPTDQLSVNVMMNSVSTDSGTKAINNVTLKHLPQLIISGVKKFVFFIGHCRSGHSIVGSILDGHPHIVISHESKIFRRLAKTPSKIDKSYIFNTIWTSAYMSARESGIRTIRSRANGKGYTLAVGGLYQGEYESYIEVIGEKKAELTTELFLDSPTRLEGVINKLRATVGLYP